MKHLKLFEAFEEIDSICKKYNIVNYTINDDGTVDVDGDVNLRNVTVNVKGEYGFYKGLTKLPLKFGSVTGYFDCSYNQLNTLEGGPKEIGGNFICSYNQLTTLEGGPIHVGGNFDCSDNKLTTLEGAPNYVGGSFNCYNNQLTTLEGGPSYVGGGFYCGYNQLTTLEGGPDHVGRDFYCHRNKLITLEGSPIEIGGSFYCEDNPIYSIYKLFPNYKAFRDSLEYNYLRGTDIVRSRFEEACEEAGIRMPKKINGYNWI